MRRLSGRRAHAGVWSDRPHAQTANDLLASFVCSLENSVHQICAHTVDWHLAKFALVLHNRYLDFIAASRCARRQARSSGVKLVIMLTISAAVSRGSVSGMSDLR